MQSAGRRGFTVLLDDCHLCQGHDKCWLAWQFAMLSLHQPGLALTIQTSFVLTIKRRTPLIIVKTHTQ